MNYLFAFHVGPVQDFISAARRTQDLWIGSWLISHLSRQAYETGRGNGGAMLLPFINPHQLNGSEADTPNIFTMRFIDKSETEAKELAKRIEGCVRGEWSRIAAVVKGKIPNLVSDDLWDRQIENCLEVYWALVEDDDTEAARQQAMLALDARKRTRDFVFTEERHQKCTLCGLRQELSGTTTIGAARQWWQACSATTRVREDGNERLCAVCAIKRLVVHTNAIPDLAHKDGAFPSTSSLAAACWKRSLIKKIQSEPGGPVSLAINTFLRTVTPFSPIIQAQINGQCLPGLAATIDRGNRTAANLLEHDGDIFYAEFWEPQKFRNEYKNNPHITDQDLRDVKDALLAIAKEKPAKYYAALLLDGDHMGELFAQADLADALAFSEAISTFATEQGKAIVEQHLGRVVYAGGDDLMAFVPLDELLPCLRELKEKFTTAIAHLPNPERVTPSIGVAVAHHTSPLDLTLRAMHSAERQAKKHYGRDAVCIHVLKKSGEEMQLGSHWYDDAQSTIALVEQMVTYLRDDVLSSGLIKSLVESSEVLGQQNMPKLAQISEWNRLAQRQRGKAFTAAHKPEIKSYVEALVSWARQPYEGEINDKLGLDKVGQWLALARFIVRGGGNEE